MTEQLHDLLARIADQAGPGSSDPTLWARAGRARRRDRALRASAATLTVLALVGALAIGLGTRSAPPPANPAPRETGVGIPSTVRGIHGDGGLDLETDLAVGPASVAIVNQSGAFVITADDGIYHRLRLPGFDPTAFNDDEPGLALSPDGTRLAYGWRAAQAPGARIGTRILDLRTGALQKIPDAPRYVVDTLVRISTHGYGWSPNGRYLIFETLDKDPSGPYGGGPEHLYVGVDTATTRFFFFSHEARAAYCDPTACLRMTVVNPDLFARVDPGPVPFTGIEGSALVFSGGNFPLPGDASWNVGRFTPDGRRILLQPDGVGAGLLLVTDIAREATAIPLPLDSAEWPDGARIDVLGWVGPDHALAMMNRGTAADTWEPGGELVLVDVSSVTGTTVADTPIHLDVVGHIEPSDPGSSYSFATDFATVDAPTQDFDNSSSPQASDPSRHGTHPSQDHNDGDTTRLVAFTAAGLIVVAAISLVLARSRRKRNIHL